MISGPTALLASKVEIISKISCSLTTICERTFLHLISKGGRCLLLSLRSEIEQTFLFNISAFSKQWKTIYMLIENERFANTMPSLRDRDNNFSLSYDCFTLIVFHDCSTTISH
jgi:hypothetical protein